MTHLRLTIVRHEQRALSAMPPLLADHRRRNTLPDFDALRAVEHTLPGFEMTSETGEREARRAAFEAAMEQ